MTHQALARKYRPTRFADLVAQEHVAAGLAGAVARNRVAHGYLLTGSRGIGKTTAARVLAMALNCEERQEGHGEPCGECDSCRRIWSGGTNLDVVEIDAASNRGVDDARELRERAMYAASGPDRFKVYIVDEAHMLTREAWNALLKILEEPPPRVVFVFATTEPQKIANTSAAVLSRLQRFDFRRIGSAALIERLRAVVDAEGVDAEVDALRLIARLADGSMRDALSLLDQALVFGDGTVTAAHVREALGLLDDEVYAELLRLVSQRRAAEVFPFVARLVDQGADLVEFVNGAGEVLRALMVTRLGGAAEGLTEGLRATIAELSEGFSEGDILRMLALLSEAELAIRRSPNARLHVETLLLHWTILDRTVELADVLRALRGLDPSPGRTRADHPAPTTAPPRPNPAASAPGAGSLAAPTPGSAPPPEPRGPLTLGRLQASWEGVLDAVGRRSRMTQQALATAQPTAVQGDRVVLEVGDEHQREGLARGRQAIEEAIGEVVGGRPRVAVEAPSEVDQQGGAAARRLTPETDRQARMRGYRSQDPALDAMADALDLELME